MSITYFHVLSSYTHSMTLTVECTHSTFKSLNVHIQWLLAIECVDSMAWHLHSIQHIYKCLVLYTNLDMAITVTVRDMYDLIWLSLTDN